MPASEDHAILQTMIATLSQRLASPAFEVHCTLGTLDHYTPQWRAALQEVAATCPAFGVTSTRISRQPHFYQRLILHLAKVPALLHLHQRLAQLGAAYAAPYQPHISLVYGAAPEYRLDQVAPMAGALQYQPWQMDHLAVVRSHPVVEQWQVIERLPLMRRVGV